MQWLVQNDLGAKTLTRSLLRTCPGLFIREMADMTVGILGYGHLGRECSRLASSFGSRIIACSREGAPKSIKGYLIPGTGDVDAKLPEKWFKTDTSSLQDFLAECDVVVNCLPHSTQTHHIIGEAELKIMKNDSIFINIGRGQTVDQVALVKALKAEPTTEQGALKIGAAGLDVTDPEPLPDGHELFTMPNGRPDFFAILTKQIDSSQLMYASSHSHSAHKLCKSKVVLKSCRDSLHQQGTTRGWTGRHQCCPRQRRIVDSLALDQHEFNVLL